MADFKITRVLENVLNIKNQEIVLKGVYFNQEYTFVLSSPQKKILHFGRDLSDFKSEKVISDVNFEVVKAVLHKENFFLICCNRTIYKCQNTTNSQPSQLERCPLWNIIAITEFRKGFACLGKNKNGSKLLASFELDSLPSFQECTFSDLNRNNSEDYYLTSIKRQYDNECLIISDRYSGETYLCTENGQVSMIHASKFPLISAFSIMSEDCLLLCFKNGKLFLHFFSQDCSVSSLFLNERVLCIEKCFCNDSCFLWSDGANIHHTEINFNMGDLTMRHFKVQNNIVGVISLFKVGHYIIATSINNAMYEIRVSENARKEIFRAPSEILSQIYSNCLKINDFQKKLEFASEYLRIKERIQNNELRWTLSREGSDLTLKNISEMTFKEEIWKIELRAVCDEEFVWVKVIKLETDVTSGMTIKVKNPFDKSKRFNVFLVGVFEEQILGCLIGTVWEEAPEEKRNLKKLLLQTLN